MDRDEALDRLPPTYARALRLAGSGASAPAIAAELGIDAASVGPLLTLGREKLARLLEDEAMPEDPPAPAPEP